MKRNKVLSWVLSLVMALTVFSIPVGGVYAAESSYALLIWGDDGMIALEDDVNYGEVLASDPYSISITPGINEDGYLYSLDSTYDVQKIVWYNSNPSAAGIVYYDENWDQVISFDEKIELSSISDTSIQLLPKRAEDLELSADITYADYDTSETKNASFHLTVHISGDDLTQYCLAAENVKETSEGYVTEYIPYDPAVDYDDMAIGNYYGGSMALCSKYGEEWERFCEASKFVWTNNSTGIVSIGYDGDETIISSDETFTITPSSDDDTLSPDFFLIPKSGGTAELSLDVYDKWDTQNPAATIPISITIKPETVDKTKFGGYLNCYDYILDCVDYDDLEGWGTLPDIDNYNADLEEGEYKIQKADVKNMTVTIKIGDKTYTTSPKWSKDEGRYVIEFKIAKAALGASVTVTYKMGTCTKTEKLLVTKYVEPKITYKNQIYNGKVLKPKVTVTVGKTTLKQGTDYIYECNGRKDVGSKIFYISSNISETPKSKYRMWEYRYYKINPKGTTIKKPVAAKKAITVKWAKQATKMSTSRITGYQIQLATNKAFTKNKKLVTVKGYANVSKKVTKLKAKTKYFVRVRTYKIVNKKYYYSTWSSVKYVKTK